MHANAAKIIEFYGQVEKSKIISKDIDTLLSTYLCDLPTSLIIREVLRFNMLAHEIGNLPSIKTILDVGCGDGIWWRGFEVNDAAIYGVDISSRELPTRDSPFTAQANLDISKANASETLQTKGWPETMDLCIGNCSLEHIFDLNTALTNIFDLVKPGGHLLLFVPTPTWTFENPVVKRLSGKFPRIFMTFSGALNGFFQHWHLFDSKTWSRVLTSHGFKVEKVSKLGTIHTESLFWLGLPTAFISFLIKTMTSRYLEYFLPMWIKSAKIAFIRPFLRAAIRDHDHLSNEAGAYEYAILCRKEQ